MLEMPVHGVQPVLVTGCFRLLRCFHHLLPGTTARPDAGTVQRPGQRDDWVTSGRRVGAQS